MKYREELENLGVNIAEGVDRVMGDEELYETMLGIFVDTVKENPISPEDFAGNDLNALTDRVHMMKGMTGNLSLMPLFDAYMETLSLLRDNKPVEARAIIEKMLPVQTKIIDCIVKNQS